GLDKFKLHELAQAIFAAAKGPSHPCCPPASSSRSGHLSATTSLPRSSLPTPRGPWSNPGGTRSTRPSTSFAAPTPTTTSTTRPRSARSSKNLLWSTTSAICAPPPRRRSSYDRSQVARKLVFDDDDDGTSLDETEGTVASSGGYDSSSSEDTKATGRKSCGGRASKRDAEKAKSRARSSSRRREKDYTAENNPCKHCHKYKRVNRHPKVTEDECFFNKKYKGFRPRYVYKAMKRKFYPRSDFESDDEGGKIWCGPATSSKSSLSNNEWINVNKGTTKTFNKIYLVQKKPSYIALSNTYANLSDFAVDPPEPEASPQAENSGDRIKPNNFGSNPTKTKPSKFKRKAIARFLKRQLKREKYADEANLLDRYIEEVEDERTALARKDTTNPQFVAAEKA
ncbi:hypothetical protein ACHAWF_001828, partial [Thalassiosira exigua]